MSKDQVYICTCGFHGEADAFNRHEISAGYNYGHGNAAPAEVELQCPECGEMESDSIVPAELCDYCQKWHPEEQIKQAANSLICEVCLNSNGFCICPTCKAVVGELKINNCWRCASQKGETK